MSAGVVAPIVPAAVVAVVPAAAGPPLAPAVVVGATPSIIRPARP